MAGLDVGQALAISGSPLYPNYLSIQRRQALGQALLGEGASDPGHAAFGGLRNAGNALLGAYLLKNADKDMSALYGAPPDGAQAGGQPTGQISNTAGQQQTQAQQIGRILSGPPDAEGNPVDSYQSPMMTSASDAGGNPVQAQVLPPQQNMQQSAYPQAAQQPQAYAQPANYQQQPQARHTIPGDLGALLPDVPGKSHATSMLMLQGAPEAYWNAVSPTPEYRNALFAAGGNDAAARQLLLAKAMHDSFVNMRGGNFGFNPVTGQGFGVPDNKGMVPTMGADGQMGMQLAPGAGQALAGSAAATQFGQRTMTPATGYDSNGQPYGTNQASLYGLGGAQQPTAQPQPGANVPNIERNNPLNVSPGGQVAQYQTPTAGLGTAWELLGQYGQRGINTVNAIVRTWAPNAPPQYVQNVAAALRVNPDQPLDLRNPNVKGALIDAMRPNETGQRYAPQQTAQNGQQPIQPPQAAPGPLRPELPAGQAQFMQGQAKDAADRHDATVAAASESPMRINVLDNIINLSGQGVSTGPGAEWQANVLGYAANTPILGRIFANAPDNVSKFQELQKFMYQNALRNWQAAGGTGTDRQMESMQHANPNDHLFPAALQQIAKWGKASELAVQGKANAQDRFLQQNGNTAPTQIQFEKTWRNAFDPKVFQYSLMSPAEKQAFARSLGSPQNARAFMAKQQQLQALGALP